MPDNDPVWKEAGTLWNKRWDIRNIDKIIDNFLMLEKKYPEKAEPALYLGKAYLIKASYDKFNDELMDKAALCAEKAYFANSKNNSPLKLLVFSVIKHDTKSTYKKYSEWFKRLSPFPSGRALPELTNYPEWKTAIDNWDKRADIELAKSAVDIFKKIADKNPASGAAQTWTARGMYYLGYYYHGEAKEDISSEYFKTGAAYGEKAFTLLPHSVQAHYWYALNYARTIQNASLYNKAMNFRPILDHTMFCTRENPTYFYFGPILVLGTTISKGGWVTKMVLEKTVGLTIEDVLRGLDFAETVHPDYLYIPYCRAEILYSTGNNNESKKYLLKVLSKDPYLSKYHFPENIISIKLAKRLLEKIKN